MPIAMQFSWQKDYMLKVKKALHSSVIVYINLSSCIIMSNSVLLCYVVYVLLIKSEKKCQAFLSDVRRHDVHNLYSL